MSQPIQDWRPEDPEFWRTTGKKIAKRNLLISIPALFLAFAMWQVWSVTTLRLNGIGFQFSKSQLFWLAAVPALSGSVLRAVYSFMVPIFGGRRWTAISTASLLLPAIGIGMAVQDTNTSYATMIILALLCGFGGGNFSSSMANISFFYPRAEKGTALGLNAGLGNLGVSAVQFVVPIVIAGGLLGSFGGAPQTFTDENGSSQIWLQNAGFVWVPVILVSALAAWFGMDDLACAKASFKDQASIFKRKHTWLMCILYLGTFGSFLGFSAGFPQLAQTLFPHIILIKYIFWGPLIGAVMRPIGGWVADKLGGAFITNIVFVGMAAGTVGVLSFLPDAKGNGGSFWGFFACFMVLFGLAGLGNGSTFMQMPAIFSIFHKNRAEAGHTDHDTAGRDALRESAAVVGFTAAFAGFGGFFIPTSYGLSIKMTDSVNAALYLFIGLYVVCAAINWWYYLRKNAETKC